MRCLGGEGQKSGFGTNGVGEEVSPEFERAEKREFAE
jgi:hypothetical protein